MRSMESDILPTEVPNDIGSRFRRSFRNRRWTRSSTLADGTEGQDIIPQPPQRLFAESPTDNYRLPDREGVVSNFNGLRNLRRLKSEYLDEGHLIQHERKCDEHYSKVAAGSWDTGGWLKFIKGARARSQARADYACDMLCHVMIPEVAQTVASFTGGDSCSEYAAATMDTDVMPNEKSVQDVTDDVDGNATEFFRDATFDRNTLDAFDDDIDPFSRIRPFRGDMLSDDGFHRDAFSLDIFSRDTFRRHTFDRDSHSLDMFRRIMVDELDHDPPRWWPSHAHARSGFCTPVLSDEFDDVFGPFQLNGEN